MAPYSSAPVLVTGITSFVGTTLVRELVEAGYTVRGTVRSKEKFDKWIAEKSELKSNVGYVIVEDVAAPGAFDKPEIWKDGVELVAHTASPFHYNFTNAEEEMLKPAIEGTVEILKSAAKQPSVKRVVITSSFAAVLDVDKAYRPGYTYTADDWNPATYESAAKRDLSEPLGGAYVYCASKGLAEKAAWDFVENEKPSFTLSSINPPLIFGPPEQPIHSTKEFNTSAAEIWGVIGGANKGKDTPQTGFPTIVDVREVASAHIRALERDQAQGQRYLLNSGKFWNEDVVRIAKKEHPEIADRLPNVASDWKAPEAYFLDVTKTTKDLGIQFSPIEKVISDTINALLAIEKKAGGQ